MTKCPYVPPHPWNVDFPHLMLRAKAREVPRRATSSSATAAHQHRPRSASSRRFPVVVQMVNTANTTPSARKVMRQGARHRRGSRAAAVRRRDAFATHAEPSHRVAGPRRRAHARQGRDLRDLLRQLQRAGHRPRPAARSSRTTRSRTALVEKEACCGMPKLELGDLEAVEKLKNINIPPLAALAREGYAILTPVPSCTLMFKQELPLMFPDDADVEGRRRRDVRSVRVPRAARQGRPAEEGFQAAARQGELSHPVPLARAEHRPEDARGAAMDARAPRSTPSSAAPATTAPGA